MAGKFIVLEGIDGSGKTTQIQILSEYMKRKGVSFVLTKNPTTGRIGAILKGYYLKNKTSALADALLFAADRAEQVEAVIKPALRENKVVISDRYFYSNLVYQSAEGADPGWLEEINKFFPRPEIVFLIDVSSETAIERIKKERGEPEKFEKIKILENLRKKYLETAKKFKEIVVVDGERKTDEIQEEIIKKINAVL